MSDNYRESRQISLDVTLQALTDEVGRLERLAQWLNVDDRGVLQACSTRINRLVLDKLTSTTNHLPMLSDGDLLHLSRYN